MRLLLLLAALTLPAGAATAQSDGKDRTVVVHNHTKKIIQRLYWTNVATDNWGGDRLGGTVVSAMTHRTFDLSDGSGACRFDLKAVMSDGEEIVSRNVDVCKVGKWFVGPAWDH